MKNPDKEIEILENIYHNSCQLNQRNLAKIADLSLGMTNAILKRLVTKGWLTIKKVNNRNIRYAVSSKGIEEITRRSYHYFKRTIKNVVFYRESLEALIIRIKDQGYIGVLLVGKSDLDFIVEHFCTKTGLELLRQDPVRGEKVFLLYSESYLPDEKEKNLRNGVAFLQDLLV